MKKKYFKLEIHFDNKKKEMQNLREWYLGEYEAIVILGQLERTKQEIIKGLDKDL